jgi:hypothetical protein
LKARYNKDLDYLAANYETEILFFFILVGKNLGLAPSTGVTRYNTEEGGKEVIIIC